MDKIIQNVLSDFVKKYSQEKDGKKLKGEADLRDMIKKIFEQVVTIFLFG